MFIEQLAARRLFSVIATSDYPSGIVGPPPLSLSGTVFFDKDHSGTTADRLKQTDTGVPGVRVYLDLDDDGRRGKKEPSTFSSETGGYFLIGFDEDHLDATIRCVTPAGYTATTPAAQHHDDTRTGPHFGLHQARPTGSIATSVLLPAALRDSGFGSSMIMNRNVGGVRVWLDLDRDGRRDKKEPQALTSNDGRVHFNDLMPGSYVLRLSTPEGFGVDRSSVTLNVADRQRRNSDFTLSGTRTVTFSFYRDANSNSRRDSNEPGITFANRILINSLRPIAINAIAGASMGARQASLPRVAASVT